MIYLTVILYCCYEDLSLCFSFSSCCLLHLLLTFALLIFKSPTSHAHLQNQKEVTTILISPSKTTGSDRTLWGRLQTDIWNMSRQIPSLSFNLSDQKECSMPIGQTELDFSSLICLHPSLYVVTNPSYRGRTSHPLYFPFPLLSAPSRLNRKKTTHFGTYLCRAKGNVYWKHVENVEQKHIEDIFNIGLFQNVNI